MKISPAPLARPRRSGAFTLIEVVLAMVILSLVLGAVFTILQSTMRASVEITKRELQSSQVTALREQFRRTFGALPSGAQIRLEVIEAGDPMLQELTISGAPEAFVYGPRAASTDERVFGLQRQTDASGTEDGVPLYTFGFTRADLVPEEEVGLVVVEDGVTLLVADDEGRYWFPLVRDIVSMEWRCYLQEDESWEEVWEESEAPPLIQVEIRQRGRDIPMRLVFPVVVAESVTS